MSLSRRCGSEWTAEAAEWRGVELAAPELLRLVDEVRRRLRRVLWLRGLAWLGAVLFGVSLLVGLLDWGLRSDWVVWLVVLAATVWLLAAAAAWRYLLVPLRRPLSDVDVSLAVERRFPVVRDLLSSSVQFVRSGFDPRLGSPELQRRAVQRVARHAGQLTPAEVVRSDAPLLPLVLAAAGLLGWATLFAFWPESASVACRRLALPFSAPAWPRQTVLVFLSSDLRPWQRHTVRLPQGRSVEVFVRNDRGPLPDDLRVLRRDADGVVSEVPFQRVTLPGADARGHELARMQLTVGELPFELRATGGDDRRMPWYWVEGRPPVQLKRFRLRLTPPTYTGLPARELPPDVGDFEAVLGTQVELTAWASKPLRAARLVFPRRSTVPLDVDGQQVTGRFVVRAVGSRTYWLEMLDREGLPAERGPSFRLLGVADGVPKVVWQQPTSDLWVTPDALVPLAVRVEDDWGVQSVRLRFERTVRGSPDGSTAVGQRPDTPEAATQRRPLAASDATAGPRRAADGTGTTNRPASVAPGVPEPSSPLGPGNFVALFEGDANNRPTELTLRHSWALAKLRLSVGDRVRFWVEATDACDAGRPHVGRSELRTLTVVSPSEKADELARGLSQLLRRIEQAKAEQQRLVEQTRRLQEQLPDRGRPSDDEAARLKQQLEALRSTQRRLAETLTGKQDSLRQAVERLSDEVETNRLAVPELRERLEEVGSELQRLEQSVLPELDRRLSQSTAAAEGAPEQEGWQQPRRVQERQQEQEQQERRQQPQQQRERQQRQQQQQEQQKKKGPASQDEPSAESDSLEGRPAKAKNVDRQSAEAKNTGQGSAQTKSSERRSTPTESGDERRVEAAPSTQASGRSDKAALKQVEQAQQQVVQSLERMRQALVDWNDLGQLLRELRELSQQQEQLIEQTKGVSLETLTRTLSELLRHQREQLRQLAEQQRQHGDRVDQLQDRLGRQLDRRSSNRPPEFLREALETLKQQAVAGKMREAAEHLEQNRIGQALTAQQQALQQLRELEKKLRSRGTAGSTGRPGPQPRQRLDDLLQQQRSLLQATRELDEQRQQRGNWSRSQLKRLGELADAQQQLQQLAQQAAVQDRRSQQETSQQKTSPLETSPLERAARAMAQAAQRLRQRQADQQTQRLQAESLRHLQAARQQQQRRRQLAAQSGRSDSGRPRTGRDNKRPSRQQEQQQPPKPDQAARAGTGGLRAPERPGDAPEPTVPLLLQRQFLMEHVWGHLPPNVRQQLFNAYSENPLPQYRHVIERYYQSLAEPGSSTEPQSSSRVEPESSSR